MSVAVDLADLDQHIADIGANPYLTTVGDGGAPHIVSVNARIDGDTITADAGRTSLANARVQPAVTLMWAAPPGTDYCLIVDGTASQADSGDALRIAPLRAVLHRVAGANDDQPSCIRILDRRPETSA